MKFYRSMLRKNREFFVLPLKLAIRNISEIASKVNEERKTNGSEEQAIDNFQIIAKYLNKIQTGNNWYLETIRIPKKICFKDKTLSIQQRVQYIKFCSHLCFPNLFSFLTGQFNILRITISRNPEESKY